MFSGRTHASPNALDHPVPADVLAVIAKCLVPLLTLRASASKPNILALSG